MRKSGVLLHVTSLPSPGGCGTLGEEARAFVDWLRAAGMSIWQVLPVGPTGYGNSPYQSPSTFAGNLMMIDLRTLYADGLLSDPADVFIPNLETDEELIRRGKFTALRRSFSENREKTSDEVRAFLNTHPHVEEYALFMAVKDYFGGRMWTQWPDMAIRLREEAAVAHYSRILSDDVAFYCYAQYLFHRQWSALKEYANKNGISILGDMPIYVAEDSADTWANPEMFQLDRDRRPIKVAGVPPDYFSEDGQKWGNPLYHWKNLKRTGFRWWLERLKYASELYDSVRIDHFIGFANYYSIKAGAPNARIGHWEKAPGFRFFRTVRKKLPGISIVAEDLGVVSRRVRRLLKYTGYPGMRVLQFGFDSDTSNPHFLNNIPENCLLYTGTHDNDTAEGWWATASESTKEFADSCLPERDRISERMAQAALNSMADTVIIPAQDILGLGSEARMNTPGTVGAPNWQWRMPPDALTGQKALEYRDMNEYFERNQK